MRKVVFGINITADGFCGHADGVADDALHSYFTSLLRNASVILYGRVTYELMVPFWPEIARNQTRSAEINEFARVFDGLDMVVFSTTLTGVEGAHRRLAAGGLAEEVLALKQLPGKDICIGSLSIASQLSERGLIDEYRFVVHPIVAGKGPRLFEALTLKGSIRLELVGSEAFSSGAVANHYRVRR
jgi:dihydrofolate reductase